MSGDDCGSGFDWGSITSARARLLRELADGRTQHEICERNQMTYAGVRSLVEDLKAITGCRDVRELGRWWRENRAAWIAWCGRQAGVVGEEGYAS